MCGRKVWTFWRFFFSIDRVFLFQHCAFIGKRTCWTLATFYNFTSLVDALVTRRQYSGALRKIIMIFILLLFLPCHRHHHLVIVIITMSSSSPPCNHYPFHHDRLSGRVEHNIIRRPGFFRILNSVNENAFMFSATIKHQTFEKCFPPITTSLPRKCRFTQYKNCIRVEHEHNTDYLPFDTSKM